MPIIFFKDMTSQFSVDDGNQYAAALANLPVNLQLIPNANNNIAWIEISKLLDVAQVDVLKKYVSLQVDGKHSFYFFSLPFI